MGKAAHSSQRVVGRCIYCGSAKALTNEHTVPYGLNGASILRKASCKACAAITSAFERSVLRETLEKARHVLQYRTRRPNRRQASYIAEVVINGEVKKVDMPVEACAAIVPFVDLGMPTHLVEKYNLSGDEYRIGYRHTVSVPVSRSWAKTKAFLESIGAERINSSGTFNAYEYLRLLAKIAYCETVSLCGLENIKKAYLVDFILTGRGDPFQYIGGQPPVVQAENPDTNPDVRAVSIKDGEFLGHVQLFVPLGAPQYVVVVGSTADEYRKELHANGFSDA
jgi:hypothetical protein